MPETTAPCRPARPDYTHSLSATALALAALLTGCTVTPETPAAPAEPQVPVTAPTPEAAAPTPPAAAPAPVFVPAPRAPATHTVVKGDTLWDISERFLRDPWKWPDIWKVNPQIQNPHLIYPGDVITLTYDANGQAVLTVTRNGEQAMTSGPVTYTTEIGSAPPTPGVVKVRPRIRAVPLEEAVQTIPMDVIRPFLSRTTVIEEDALQDNAYVMRTVDGRLLGGAGDRVYVRSLPEQEAARFTLVRVGDPYEDPDTGDVLGYEGLFVGEAVVEQYGDPGVVAVESSRREVQQGDRLMSGVVSGTGESFVPRGARPDIDGKIIDVVDGVGQIGQYAIVALNRGNRHGLRAGDVLLVMQARGETRDKAGRGALGKLLGFGGSSVDLPDERAGEVMVFRAYDKLSFALVMRATSEIHVGDAVRSPN
jgi:hypothetical protein